MTATILFAGYEEANLGCIAPVLAALVRERVARPIVVPGVDFKPHRGLRTAPPVPGLAARPIAAALTGPERARAERRGRALTRAARRWAATPPDAAPPRERLAAAALRRLFDQPAMPEIFAAYASVDRAIADVLRRERPRLVVVPEDTDYMRGRLVARIVAAHGVRLVCLTPWYYSVFRSYPLVGARRADHFLVGTRAHAGRLRAAGVAPSAITVVGHPELDAITPTPAPPPGAFLYALQGMPWEREIATDLTAILRDEPRARLIIRPHPALPRPAWLDAIDAPRTVRVAPATARATTLLDEAQCVVAQTSRMLWEASLRGRSVLLPHYDATPLTVALPAGDRRAVVARSAAELRRRVRTVLDGRGRGLTRPAIAPHHPRATARVVAALRALLPRD